MSAARPARNAPGEADAANFAATFEKFVAADRRAAGPGPVHRPAVPGRRSARQDLHALFARQPPGTWPAGRRFPAW